MEIRRVDGVGGLEGFGMNEVDEWRVSWWRNSVDRWVQVDAMGGWRCKEWRKLVGGDVSCEEWSGWRELRWMEWIDENVSVSVMDRYEWSGEGIVEGKEKARLEGEVSG